MKIPALLLLAAILAAQNEPSGSIEGTVIDDATGEPVRNAAVHLYGPVPPFHATTSTDSAGRFAVRKLAPAQYAVTAEREGYLAAGRIAIPVEVAAGSTEPARVVVRLMRESAISGKVLDEFDGGLGGCAVFVAPRPSEVGGITRVGRSDATGAYRVDGLSPGRYALSARCYESVPAPHPLMPKDQAPRQVYEFPNDPSAPTTLVKAGLETGGVDLRLARVTMLRVTGRIVAAEPGVLSRELVAWVVPEDAPREYTDQLTLQVEPGGVLKFPPMKPGRYRAMAGTTDDGPSFVASQVFEAGKTGAAPLVLTLERAPDLAGSVSFADGRAIPSDLVVQIGPLGLMMGHNVPFAKVAASGAFQLRSVWPGHWHVGFGGGFFFIKSAMLGGREVNPYDFEFGPGSAGPLAIVLSDHYGQIDGRVADAGPDTAATVFLARSDSRRAPWEGKVGYGAQGGRVQIRRVAPGRYRLLALETADSTLGANHPELFEKLSSSVQEIDVAEDGRVNIDLPLVRADDWKRALEESQ